VLALLTFVAVYVAVIFYKEDFSFYDAAFLTDFSVQGRNLSPPIWPGVGRFYPLALQEFNVLRFITRTPAGYHTFAVAQLIIVVVALIVILREHGIIPRVLILIGALLAPSFLISFAGLINPERDLVFWLAIVLLCLHGYSKTRAAIYFVGCLVATHFALYYKEPFVVFVAAYADGRVLLDTLLRRRTGQGSWQELVRANSLQIGMLTISAFYAALFLTAMFPFKGFFYIGTHQVGLWSAIVGYFRIDPILFALIPIFVLRLGRFVFAEGQLDPLWDPLALGAVAWFSCLIALRMFHGVYTAPADLVALLYLTRLSFSWLSKPTRVRVSVLAAAFTCILLNNAAYSSFWTVERKGVMIINSRLGEFLRNYRPTGGAGTVEVFFPYADGYRLSELSAYLRYIGSNLDEKGARGPEGGPSLVIEGREAFADMRCVEYKDYTCIHADSAGDGALVVVLPDDRASDRDVQELRRDSVLLLSMKLYEACSRPGSWFRSLHSVRGYFWGPELPEHWLQLHVFKKRRLARS
jgi:hypothetical protein